MGSSPGAGDHVWLDRTYPEGLKVVSLSTPLRHIGEELFVIQFQTCVPFLDYIAWSIPRTKVFLL